MTLFDTVKYDLRLIRYTYEHVYVNIVYSPNTLPDYFRKKGAKIGKNCCFYSSFPGSEPYLLDIGENVFIAGEVVLHTHNPGSWIVKPDGSEIWGFGKIKIEDDCIIGTRVQVMHNVRIGRNSIVGAGSVVISDVPPNSVIMGVPARVMGSSLTYKEKALALWQSQIPPGWRNIPANRKVEKMKNHLLYMFGNYKDGELPKT